MKADSSAPLGLKYTEGEAVLCNYNGYYYEAKVCEHMPERPTPPTSSTR